jgi:biotin synthase
MSTTTTIQFENKKSCHQSSCADIVENGYTAEQVLELFELPFADLLFKAQQVHRQYFNPNEVQRSTLLSIKTGGCPENCSYCPQSSHYDTGVKATKMMELEQVVEAAKVAQAAGATRFCMGAAFRAPKDSDIEKVNAMVKAVKDLGLETCATLGLLKEHQAHSLKDAGLDYYNHNLDTAPEFYEEIISTRMFEDRLETLEYVRDAGMKVCCGGIIGMGETRKQRAGLLASLANLSPQPESVPINSLVQVEGTPLHGQDKIDELEFVRTIACARILMPQSRVRLSAGRQSMSESTQALCFLAGANSIFYGEKLLTTGNPEAEKDENLFAKLGIINL